jgi:hypothetical protein
MYFKVFIKLFRTEKGKNMSILETSDLDPVLNVRIRPNTDCNVQVVALV